MSENPSELSRSVIRSFEVGGLTVAELLQEFERCSISVNEQGHKLLTNVVVPSASCRIKTIELTVGDLGFSQGTKTLDLFQRAHELGLKLCSLESAPFMRLQYLDQPEGFWIMVASELPPTDSDLPSGFYLRRLEDGLWLRGYTADSEHVWDADDHFIFLTSENETGPAK